MNPGVNVFGYVNAESGVGEHTRLLVRTLQHAEIPYSVIPFDKTLSRQEVEFSDWGSGEIEFDINIVGVNADSVKIFVDHFGSSVLEGRYTIGLWAWELDQFPRWMAESEQFVDEVWANSTFSARSIANEVFCPVLPFPLPIVTPHPEPRSRADLGLPEGFLFMFCFDFDSIFRRKNPLAVIDAFCEAFAPGEGPKLFLKSINGERHPEHLEAVEKEARRHRDIVFVNRYFSQGDQKALIAACDAYVSLHRAEGFGLTMAEAMALGKPVIGTGYSGNLDFMTPFNSYLVRSSPSSVGCGCDPYPEDWSWAEPDPSHAAELMRAVYQDRDEARRRTRRAVEDIAREHSEAARSRFVVDRLMRIREHLAQPVSTEERVPKETRMVDHKEISRQLADLEYLVSVGAQADGRAVLGGPGRWIRKLMLRATRHARLHQSDVDGRIIDILKKLALGGE